MLTSNPDSSDLKKINRPYWRYRYARSPRNPERDIFQMDNDVHALIGDHEEVVDFLYSFRVWSNYLGIRTILKIEDGAYLRYLYQNLATVCFFYGCFAELMSLALLGQDKTMELLHTVSQESILRRAGGASEDLYFVPVFLRFRIYERL